MPGRSKEGWQFAAPFLLAVARSNRSASRSRLSCHLKCGLPGSANSGILQSWRACDGTTGRSVQGRGSGPFGGHRAACARATQRAAQELAPSGQSGRPTQQAVRHCPVCQTNVSECICTSPSYSWSTPRIGRTSRYAQPADRSCIWGTFELCSDIWGHCNEVSWRSRV